MMESGNTKNTKTMYKAFEISPAMWRGIRADAATGVNAGFKFIKFRTPTQQELDDVGGLHCERCRKMFRHTVIPTVR